MTGHAKERQRYMDETGALHLLNYCAALRKEYAPVNPHKLLLGVLRRRQGIVLDKHMLCDLVQRSKQVDPGFLMRTLALSVPATADCRDPTWHRVVLQAANLLASLCDAQAISELLEPDLPPLAQLALHLARSRVAALRLPPGYEVDVLVPFTCRATAYARIASGRLLQSQLDQLDWVFLDTDVAWRLVYIDPFPDAALAATAKRILHSQCEAKHVDRVVVMHIPSERDVDAAVPSAGVTLNAAVLNAADRVARRTTTSSTSSTAHDRDSDRRASAAPGDRRQRGLSFASHKSFASKSETAASLSQTRRRAGAGRRAGSTRSRPDQAGSESQASCDSQGEKADPLDEAASRGSALSRTEVLQFALEFLAYERDGAPPSPGTPVPASPLGEPVLPAASRARGCVVLAHDHPGVVHFGLLGSLVAELAAGKQVAFFDPLDERSYPPSRAGRETVVFTYFWKKLLGLDELVPDDALRHCVSPLLGMSKALAANVAFTAPDDTVLNVEAVAHAVLSCVAQGHPRAASKLLGSVPAFLTSSWWNQTVAYPKVLKGLCDVSRALCVRYSMAYEGGSEEWVAFLSSIDCVEKWRGVIESQPADSLALEPHLPCPDLGIEQFKTQTGNDEFWRAVQMRAQDGDRGEAAATPPEQRSNRTGSVHSRRSQSSRASTRGNLAP
eukprot:TRINITY_DN22838_c0_g1_i1.p1 TRINITY_DN22838_c0_g1~~TRINITY_DN22838_c0_g1_i1.p1  ORF type:complete len:712 (+),score=168.19 TRINITY_DN22838_c0_g1_i1:123-2138(+)